MLCIVMISLSSYRCNFTVTNESDKHISLVHFRLLADINAFHHADVFAFLLALATREATRDLLRLKPVTVFVDPPSDDE